VYEPLTRKTREAFRTYSDSAMNERPGPSKLRKTIEIGSRAQMAQMLDTSGPTPSANWPLWNTYTADFQPLSSWLTWLGRGNLE